MRNFYASVSIFLWFFIHNLYHWGEYPSSSTLHIENLLLECIPEMAILITHDDPRLAIAVGLMDDVRDNGFCKELREAVLAEMVA